MIHSERHPEKHIGIASSSTLHELTPFRSKLIAGAGGAVHGITGRVPGFGVLDGNISYTSPRDAQDAWRCRKAWAAEIGVDADSIVVPWQVHGSSVFVVDDSHRGSGAAPGSQTVAQADAVVTNSASVTLMTTHADCLPILLYDPNSRSIGAIHAGWRSTVTGVSSNTVRRMNSAFGASPDDILAFLGPAICQACYEVGDDVANAWDSLNGSDNSGALSQTRPGKFQFDLKRANEKLLKKSGLRSQHIEWSDDCTRCNCDNLFSHRGQGPLTGRFAALIALEDGT